MLGFSARSCGAGLGRGGFAALRDRRRSQWKRLLVHRGGMEIHFASAEASAGCTVRLFTTVRTPLTEAASLATALRSVSLFTVPERVTTPLAASTAICLLWTAWSALSRAWMSLATCASVRFVRLAGSHGKQGCGERNKYQIAKQFRLHFDSSYRGEGTCICLDAAGRSVAAQNAHCIRGRFPGCTNRYSLWLCAESGIEVRIWPDSQAGTSR